MEARGIPYIDSFDSVFDDDVLETVTEEDQISCVDDGETKENDKCGVQISQSLPERANKQISDPSGISPWRIPLLFELKHMLSVNQMGKDFSGELDAFQKEFLALKRRTYRKQVCGLRSGIPVRQYHYIILDNYVFREKIGLMVGLASRLEYIGRK